MRRRLFICALMAGTVCSLVVLVLSMVSRVSAMIDAHQLPPLPAAATATAAVTGTPTAARSTSLIAPTTPVADTSSAQSTPVPATAGASPAAATVSALGVTFAQVAGLVDGPDKAAYLLGQMNAARADQGLAALAPDAALTKVARVRAENLVGNGYFDHYSPDGESAFSELASRGIHYHLAGENLARNNYPDGRTAGAAFDALMASASHRANILESTFTRVGVVAVRNGHVWLYVTVFTDE